MKVTIKSLFIILSFIFFFTSNAKSAEKSKRHFVTYAPRFSIGYHNYMNFELGVSKIKIDASNLMFGASSKYATFLFQKSDRQNGINTYGFKVGIQGSFVIFMGGIEWKTLVYNKSAYNYLSPKLGLSIFDVFNIEYAFNILT